MLRDIVKIRQKGHLSKSLFEYAITTSITITNCFSSGGCHNELLNCFIYNIYSFLNIVSCLVDHGFYCNYHGLDLTPSHGLVSVPPIIHSYIYRLYHYATCFHKVAPSMLYSKESRTRGRSQSTSQASKSRGVREPVSEKMAFPVPFSTSGNGLLGFGLLGNGVSMALVALGHRDRK